MRVSEYQTAQDLLFQYNGTQDGIIEFMKKYKLYNFDYDSTGKYIDFIYTKDNSASIKHNISGKIVSTGEPYPDLDTEFGSFNNDFNNDYDI